MAFINARNNVGHELGHSFGQQWYRKDGSYDPSGPYTVLAAKAPELLTAEGWPESPVSAGRTWRQNPDNSSGEVFADMFLGWVFDTWANDDIGKARNNFMTTNMSVWIEEAVR